VAPTVPSNHQPPGWGQDFIDWLALEHNADGTHRSVIEKTANKGAASGYASLDSGTKVPVAQLGTGTPDGTKFLRDDRVFALPPSGTAVPVDSYTLGSASAIGAAAIILDRAPTGLAANLGVLAIGAFTPNCEVRKVSSITGSTVNLASARAGGGTGISFDGPTKAIHNSLASLGTFFVGSKVKVTGSASNNGTFTVTAVSTDLLTLTVSETVTTEAAGANVVLTVDLNIAHSSGDIVLWITGGLIPAEVYGIKADADTGSATSNLAGLQRASNEYYWNAFASPGGGMSGIKLAPGTTYINGEWFTEDGMTVEGAGIDSSILKATGITFASSEVAIVHHRRGGDVCEYTNPGPAARLYLRHLLVHGNSISGSNGILAGVQQPQKWDSVRVNNCLGYGIAICGTQQFVANNLEMTACGISLVYRSVTVAYVHEFNSEQAVTSDFTARLQPGGIACHHNTFIDVHLEAGSAGAGFKAFDIQSGDGWMFKNVWETNPDNASTLFYFDTSVDGLTAKPIFTLENVRCNQPSTSFKVINDVNRSISRTVTAVNRYVQWIVSGIETTAWQVEITGISGGGADAPPAFARGISLSAPILINGLQILTGSGTPEGSIVAVVGSLYLRTNGGANTTLYVKESGTGNTGWIAK
jgi:hypothetical protein